MESCRTCGAKYPEAGDGWDGECPDCADRTFRASEIRGCTARGEHTVDRDGYCENCGMVDRRVT